MPDSRAFDDLIERFISEKLTAEELPDFFAFLEDEGFQIRYAARIDQDLLENAWMGWSNKRQAARLYDRILEAGNIPFAGKDLLTRIPALQNEAPRSSPSSRIGMRYAAALVVLLAAFAVYRISKKTTTPPVLAAVRPAEAPVVKDIPPGGNKAILILNDKSVLSLDSLAKGSSLVVGGMKITKTSKGEIRYMPVSGEDPEAPVVSNTVRTPRGGQFQVTLSDGTQVWLNAASSITYPTRFAGRERTVTVSGEVYFEVAENKEKPFIVNVNDNNRIEVLGTHFNVNAYDDEGEIKTTLLEGKVRVDGANKTVLLSPGQQALGTQIGPKVEIGQVMAWKNGVFALEGKNLDEVLRELARWYNLTIEYENGIPGARLHGDMGMNLNLSQVLKGLAELEVKCRLESGNRLVVLR